MPDPTTAGATAAGYDYIVVGAGSAGCALADRLTAEVPEARVLLLEAGAPDDARMHATDLGSMTSLWADPEAVWPYATVAQPGCGGRVIPVPQGRVLGGGSAVNAMLWVRGNPADYDRWAAAGCTGWSYADLLPTFAEIESYAAGGTGRGRTGALQILDYTDPAPSSAAFVTAAAGLGAAGAFDYNGPAQDGGPFYYQSTRSAADRRCSSADAFLVDAMRRPNLTVRTGCTVTRVVVERGRAVGVEVTGAPGPKIVTAAVEVILSAGSFGTPVLLLRSGIGPAEQLTGLGVEPVVDLVGVGENLQDHLLLGVAWESPVPLPLPQLLAEAGLFARSTAVAPDSQPDLQMFMGPVQFVPDAYRSEAPGFTIAPILVRPASRGTVRLDPADPAGPPLIDPHYLDRDEDVEVLVDGIELARTIVAATPFDGVRGRELAPGPAVTDRAGLAAYVREAASTVWHPVGTAAMGTGPESVVDPQLRVHGIDRLRVADASVMPSIVAGNTNATSIVIGRRAAGLVIGAAADLQSGTAALIGTGGEER